MNAIENPLTAPVPDEVPLANAPLAHVIVQVRFPTIMSVEKRGFVASFQEEIRDQYSVLKPRRTAELTRQINGDEANQSTTIWHFADSADEWQLTLSSEHLSLATTSYRSRDDFLHRFQQVIAALHDHIRPAQMNRIGIRYIDQISGDVLNNLPTFFRKDVLGIVGADRLSTLQHSVSENLFVDPNAAVGVMARWGLLPANGTVNPAVLRAIDVPSWILDIDAFKQPEEPFDVERVMAHAEALAERAYTFFRWAVTDEFLAHYGGEL